MDEKANALVLTTRGVVRMRLLTFARIDRDGARDGVVQTSVERAEVFRVLCEYSAERAVPQNSH